MAFSVTDQALSALTEMYGLWKTEPRTKLTVTEVLGAQGIKILHPAMTREWSQSSPAHHSLTMSDIEDLERNGLVEADWGSSHNGRRAELRFTRQGEAFVRNRIAPPPQLEPTGSNWATEVLPVLQAIHQVEQRVSGEVSQESINGVLGRPPNDRATSRVLERLSQAGYLTDEITVEEIEGPIQCRLSEKGLQQVAGWPGALNADLSALFLAAIEAQIANPSTSEEERGRLQRLRDATASVGQNVVTALITNAIKDQTGLS